MKSFSPLYLVIVPDNSEIAEFANTHVLQLRTEVNPLTGIKTRHNAQGETILVLPPPIIEIARGSQDDLYGLAAKMFGARWRAWTYRGDYVYSYQLQGDNGAVPPGLTPREITILNILEGHPDQTLDDLDLFMQVGRPAGVESERAQIGSALRFLSENGFVVMEKQGQQDAHDGIVRYTVRKT